MGTPVRVWRSLRLQGDHGAKKDSARKCFRPQEKHTGCDVCSIRVADRNDLPLMELILRLGGADEIG